jgi:hypothetical protein
LPLINQSRMTDYRHEVDTASRLNNSG